MHSMTKLMDYTISSLPLRIVELMVDPSRLQITSLHIPQIGHLPGRKLRRSGVTFDCWALAYLAGGKGTLQIDGGPVQELGKGSLFFVYPGSVFTYGPVEGGTWEEYYIRFTGPRVEEWIESGMVSRGLAVQLDAGEGYEQKIETILMLMESGIADHADRASLLLESLLLEFAQARAANGSTSSITRSSTAAYKVLDDIMGCLYEPIDADSLAERNHISIPTLRRLVSKYTGYSLHEYVHRLKMAEAKKLLLTTDFTVKEISRELKYEDPLYFSRLFKKFTGVSASVFRTNGA
jgi:AraC-like DNA-binding protein